MSKLATKIAMIGAGNMGAAIVRGLSGGSLISPSNIRVSDVYQPNLDRLREFNPAIVTSSSNTAVVADADIIILAVKPWLINDIAREISSSVDLSKQIVVSIAAGVSLEQLSTAFAAPEATFFRIIPNTAIEVMQSVSTISCINATDEQNNLLKGIFSELGKVFFVPENQLNALMSLSSCGIAYAFRYIRAAMEGGVEMGVYPQIAKEVVMQTLRGAVELLEATQSHPEMEIDKVTTPGGITIKGLNEMEANGFSNAVIKGLKASHLK